MTKETYLKQLEYSLRKLPESERIDAVQFYKEYFEESQQSENEVIDALGSPKKVANQVLAEHNLEQLETMEPSAKRGISVLGTVLLVIFAAPIGLPLAVAVALVFLVLVIVIAATILALGLCGVAVGIVGLGTAIFSITGVGAHWPTALLGIGTGLIAFGLGVFLALGMFYLGKAIISAIYRSIKKQSAKKVTDQ